MSGAVATGYVRLIPKFDNLKSSISKELGGIDAKGAGQKVGKLFTSGAESGMGHLGDAMTKRFSAATVAIGNIASNVVSKAFSAISSSMDSAINRVDIIENFPKVMTSLGYSTEQAAASTKIMKEAVNGLPTRLQDMTNNVQMLAATMGNLADGEVNATTVAKGFNDMMLSGGQGAEVASNAFTQYCQMLAVGKVDQQAWNSVVTAAPGQMDLLAKSMLGAEANQKTLYKALQDGTVSFDELNAAIVRLDKEGGDSFESFEAQARNATKGIGTSLANAKNRITSALADIIQAIGQENISGAIEAVTTKFGSIGKIFGGFDAEGNVVGFVAGIKNGLETAFDGWKPKFSIDWDSAFKGARETAEKVGQWISKPLSAAVKAIDEGMAHLGDTFQTALGMLNLPEIDWGKLAGDISNVISVIAGFSFDAIGNAILVIADIAGRLADVIGPAIESMRPGLEAAAGAWKDFVTPIADFITGNGPAFSGMMERIHGHIEDLKPALEHFAEAYNELAENMRPIGEVIGPAIAEILGQIGSAIVGLAPIAVWFGDLFASIINLHFKLVDNFKKSFEKSAQDIQKAWNAVVEFFNTVPGLIAGFFADLPEKIGRFFADACLAAQEVFDELVDFATHIPERIVDFFSGIGDRISQAIGSIHFPQPSIAWNEAISVGPLSFSLPHIVWNAAGAYFDRPTVLAGVGEAGGEGFVPLEGSHMYPLADAIAERIGDSGISINGPVTIVTPNPQDFYDQLTAMAMQSRRQYA